MKVVLIIETILAQNFKNGSHLPHLSGKSFATHWTFVRPLLGVRSVVDDEGRLAGECL